MYPAHLSLTPGSFAVSIDVHIWLSFTNLIRDDFLSGNGILQGCIGYIYSFWFHGLIFSCFMKHSMDAALLCDSCPESPLQTQKKSIHPPHSKPGNERPHIYHSASTLIHKNFQYSSSASNTALRHILPSIPHHKAPWSSPTNSTANLCKSYLHENSPARTD